jgi:hypothetical protein
VSGPEKSTNGFKRFLLITIGDGYENGQLASAVLGSRRARPRQSHFRIAPSTCLPAIIIDELFDDRSGIN